MLAPISYSVFNKKRQQPTLSHAYKNLNNVLRPALKIKKNTPLKLQLDFDRNELKRKDKRTVSKLMGVFEKRSPKTNKQSGEFGVKK